MTIGKVINGRALPLAVIGVAVVPLIGCGAGARSHPFSLTEVRGVFAAQKLRPSRTFDAATATDRDVARLAKASVLSTGPAHDELVRFEAASFERMRAERTSVLIFPSASPDGDISVFIMADPAHAARAATSAKSSWQRRRAKCLKQLRTPHTTGVCIPLVVRQRGNVVALFPGSLNRHLGDSVERAISDL